jgi:hypothetical protein
MPFLTKSRYRLGCECPTKIHYSANRAYHNKKSDDAFLLALAAGGFQVGELARHTIPGTLIDTLDSALALAETARHLPQADIVLHEAAFQSGDFLVRTDILAKKGNAVELIEVKSKGLDPRDPNAMKRQDGLPNATWAPYIHDIAFQTMVVRLAQPSWEVTPFLMLPNKSATAPVDGINGLFRCRRVGNNYDVSVTGPVPPAVLNSNLLVKIDVSALVQKVLDHNYGGLSFEDRARYWATELANGRKIPTPLEASKCARCEFRADAALRASGMLSGFHECWGAESGLPDEELDGPLVLDIWKFGKKQKLIDAGTYRLRDVDPDTDIPDSNPKNPPPPGWLPSERQRIQTRAVREGNRTNPVVDRPGLRAALAGLKFPLHFIDFETTRAALPFRRGEHPYGNVAFQFSHHQIEENGTIHHAHDWICLDRGRQPNEEFACELRHALKKDSGTVLHYARHERTVLGDIVKQLAAAPATPERQDLVTWLNSLMTNRMVDMLEILVRHYYHPATGGSNSLKAVLPAILSTSPFLREKYSRPVYGTPEMPSQRFSNFVWLPPGTTDPYTLLTPMENTSGDEDSDEPDGVTNGGEAMIAYAKCQFTDITDAEVEAIRKDLLKYCELDTLAMVMLWETWTHDEVPGSGLFGNR